MEMRVGPNPFNRVETAITGRVETPRLTDEEHRQVQEVYSELFRQGHLEAVLAPYGLICRNWPLLKEGGCGLRRGHREPCNV